MVTVRSHAATVLPAALAPTREGKRRKYEACVLEPNGKDAQSILYQSPFHMLKAAMRYKTDLAF